MRYAVCSMHSTGEANFGSFHVIAIALATVQILLGLVRKFETLSAFLCKYAIMFSRKTVGLQPTWLGNSL